MGWSTCVVNTCYFSKTSKHRFPNPKRNIGAFRKWVSLIGNKDLLNLSPDLVYESRRVCAAHFDQSAYGANNRLLRTAVPSLELPNPLQESELSGQQLVEPEEKKLICSIKDAKAEWKTYKAIHRDSLKRRNITKSGEAPSNIRKYVEDLEFSTPVSSGCTTSNPKDETTNSNSEISTPLTSNDYDNSNETELKQMKTEDDAFEMLTESEQHYQTQEEVHTNQQWQSRMEEKDAMELFMQSMALTIKTMPPWMQRNVKKKIFEIVNEAEDTLENYSVSVSPDSIRNISACTGQVSQNRFQ